MISVNVEIKKEYPSQVKQIKNDMNLNAYSSWIPVTGVSEGLVYVTFSDDEIILSYRKNNEKVEKRCKYKEILTAYETDAGILIRFLKRHVLLIPAYENIEENEILMDVLCYLDDKCSVLMTGRIKTYDRKRYRFRYSKFDWIRFIWFGFCILTLLFSFCAHTKEAVINGIMKREDVVEVSGMYVGYEIKDTSGYRSIIPNDLSLYLEGTEVQRVNGFSWLRKTRLSIENLQKGDMLYLLVNPHSGYVLEIRTEREMILDFEDAKSRIIWGNIPFAVWSLLVMAVFVVGMCMVGSRKKEIIKISKVRTK